MKKPRRPSPERITTTLTAKGIPRRVVIPFQGTKREADAEEH
ncbi:MAG: hypothetical protein WCI04_03150 [archaeon]